MTKFTFAATTDRIRLNGLSLTEAHARLQHFATNHGLAVHLHPGNWAGNALSTAYVPGTDSFLDAIACVRVTRYCEQCGNVKPEGQSCDCFDNNCQ